jgi:hypothetical protein
MITKAWIDQKIKHFDKNDDKDGIDNLQLVWKNGSISDASVHSGGLKCPT